MNKSQMRLYVSLFLCLVGLALVWKMLGSNDDQNWQIVQYPNGSITVRNEPGWYLTWFGKVTTYPRNLQFEFSKEITDESPKDESTRVTFNDSGTSEMDVMIRFATPTIVDKQREFHRLFGGNMENVKWAVWGHISNVLKASGPLMSASENQASRKAEFTQVATQQLSDGLYEMRRVERTLKDQYDETGKPITVYATEVILDSSGKPKVSQPSPYIGFGIAVTQFSITETNYDEQTRQQFAQKKDSFLKAESAKAQREQEVQQRLMIVERGLREKAEVEAISNKEKAQATIQAQKEKEVAETNAAKQLSVATLEKQTAEMVANKQLEVAKLERLAAEETAQKIVVLAKAEEERISLAGAITERDRVLAEIARDRDIGVAQHLSTVRVPHMVMSSGGGEAGTNPTMDLINLFLLRQSGILPPFEDQLKFTAK